MRQIEFTGQGSNTILGNFAPGDMARCSDALARHLVDEARVAKYATRVAGELKAPRRRRSGK
jgi:hypothetical protein